MSGQGLGHADQALRAVAGLPQRAGQLIGGELRIQRAGVTPGQLGHGGELAGVSVRLDPAPGTHDAGSGGMNHRPFGRRIILRT